MQDVNDRGGVEMMIDIVGVNGIDPARQGFGK